MKTFIHCLFAISVLALLCSDAFAQTVPSYVPLSGLQGWWPFNGNANDESGNNNNGTVSGPILTADRFGNANKAYSLNGSTDYISTTYTGVLGTNPRALSFWAQTADTTDPMTAVAWGDNQYYPNQGTRFGGYFNIFVPGVAIGGADCSITYRPAVPYSNNTWHHYVFQSGADDSLNHVQVFMDDSLLTQIVYPFRPNSVLNTVNNFDVQFGRTIYSPSPSYFNGQLDDIGIWDRSLTRAEIKALYLGSTAGISTIANEKMQCAVYPNPATDVIHLYFGREIKHGEIAVFNELGEKIYMEQFDGKENTLHCKLAAGIYLVHVTDGKEIFTQRMIMQ